MRPFTFIRYTAALYGLALEVFYPFDSLPVTISDEMKESLKSQAKDISYLSAIVSLSYLSLFFYLVVVFSLVHEVVRLAMHYCPRFRELVEKRTAEKSLEAQNKKKRSGRAVFIDVLSNLFFSVLLVVNDIIFNRSADASSFKQGVLERFHDTMQDALNIITFQSATPRHMLTFAIFSSMVRTIYRRRRARRTMADEEIGLAPGDMVEVTMEGQKTFALEEKLVDISDGIDVIYEKMESYAVPPAVEAEATDAEEPLIKLHYGTCTCPSLLIEYTESTFKESKIEILTETMVKEITQSRKYHVGWLFGLVKGRKITQEFMAPYPNVQTKRRGLTVDDQLRLAGAIPVFAIGDCTSTSHAPIAQVASQQGSKSASYIGSDKAIANLPFANGNIASAGVAAFLFWRSAYLGTLFSLRNRRLVANDWIQITKIFGRLAQVGLKEKRWTRYNNTFLFCRK
ncbi:hypothetical protein F5890DRAFT_1478419 [Lentinula detonsa]|uniref:NADH:ubiquinone reductase (non-electrogenic) n=1 Tax=Lentinula detonsa TaxID=2804962 RepID=A0AA38UPX7_9AGAR|nr:hypothetical protein F5890DRAFT_1478419 [Lentinula detonsa]